MFKRFWVEESGATAIEYGLIAAFFAVLIVGAFASLGEEYVVMYESVEDTFVQNTTTP